MRIIDRQAFLAIAGPVLYTKVRANCDPEESLWIKVGNAGDDDWCYDAIDASGALQCGGSEELADRIYAMTRDPSESCPMDYESTRRDGLHEGDEVKFVVFEKPDIERLSARINKLLAAMHS
uniref:Uncharacterized protein n=1 Tax=Pseudomonas fluorescens (strain SBW25) TaxID=216595 RepID=A0A0G4E5V4_PSEFS|nr:hypothetical protein [Pseudomonas fluorescens]CEK42595.1 hypothetical protein PQBR55_0216 [Pseudomonas fluorescens SBW25]